MGATLCILNEQWKRAILDEDWAAVDRIDAAREKIEALGVPAVCVDHCPTVSPSVLSLVSRVFPLFCKWENTDTCRMCVAPESGKCPAIHVDVAA